MGVWARSAGTHLCDRVPGSTGERGRISPRADGRLGNSTFSLNIFNMAHIFRNAYKYMKRVHNSTSWHYKERERKRKEWGWGWWCALGNTNACG